MAVTNFSPLLGLALPTTGDLSGTWGTAVNDQITQLLDSAVAGTTTLSADADVTLSTTNGAANQARNAVILWTASNGANIRNITAPAQSKAYLVINAGTGSVVIRASGPTTGITLPAGARALVAWNGSDFVKIVSNPVVLTTDVSGILPIANGGTGTSSTTFTNLTTNVTGTLPVANGGTGNTTAQAEMNRVAQTVTSGQYLRGDGTNVGMSAIQVADVPTLNQNTTGTAANVTGIVAVANGGTGVTTSTGTGSTVLSASPALTGVPTAPTAGTGTNTTQLATTAYVINQIGAIAAGVSSFSAGSTGFTPSSAVGGAVTLAGTLAVSNGGTGATSLTANNVVIGNGTSAPLFVAPGTAGNVLTSTGATWASTSPAAGSGSWIFLSAVTASNVATADIENTFDSTYETYLIQAEGIQKPAPAQNNNDDVQIYLKVGGSYVTASNYFFGRFINVQYASSNAAANISMTVGMNGTGAFSNVSAEVLVHRPTNPNFKHISFAAREVLDPVNFVGNVPQIIFGAGSVSNGGAITGVRFLIRNGNISGTFRLYGLKTS